MIKKIGFHTGDGWIKHLDLIKKWQPPVITVLSPNKEEIKRLREACPDTILVGRIYVNDQWADKFLQRDPVGFARHTDQEIKNRNIPEIDYWVMNNEPTPYWDRLPAINTYNLELMKLAIASNYKVGILSISVGNFDLPADNPMAYWQQVIESLKFAQEHKFPVFMHQYQKPNLINNNEDDNWLIFRLEKKVLPGLKDMGLGDLKFIITELGVDHLINNGSVGGFQKTPLSDQQYVDQLLQWERFEQEYPQVLGGCIFMLGSQNPWQSYSMTDNSNVAQTLADYYANNDAIYNGDKPDMTDNKIYIPSVKNEKDNPAPPTDVEWDARLEARGVKLTPYQPKDGEVYWKCIKGEYLEEKEHIFVNTLGVDGSPIVGTNVKFYWTDGDVDKKTKDITNDPYAYGMVDFDMHAHGNSYGTRIAQFEGSDDIWGMGLGSVEKPDWNIHVSYRFTFKRVKFVATKPGKKPTKPVTVEPTPTPNPSPSQGDTASFKGRVTATVLNVRSEPKMGDNIVSRLGNGAVVDVIEHTADGWYKIGENQYVADQWVEHYQMTDELVDSLLDNFARLFNIDPKVVRATFNIESGGEAFGLEGKPIIRFENHVFFDQLANPVLYYKYFNHDSNVHSHRWRKDENSEWVEFHGNQKLEWQVYEFAKTLDESAASNSISMGMAQIMGFNYDDIGYLSSTHMLNAFSQSGAPGYVAQVFAFFGFCLSRQGLMDHLRNKNWLQFALIYNGAASYANLLEEQYNILNRTK